CGQHKGSKESCLRRRTMRRLCFRPTVGALCRKLLSQTFVEGHEFATEPADLRASWPIGPAAESLFEIALRRGARTNGPETDHDLTRVVWHLHPGRWTEPAHGARQVALASRSAHVAGPSARYRDADRLVHPHRAARSRAPLRPLGRDLHRTQNQP